MTEQTEAGGPARNVRVVHDPDPGARSELLAAELGADLAADLPSAEREVRARVDAGRRALAAATSDDARLLAATDAIRAAAAVAPTISAADVAELERLAADLGRAHRIRERTEARFSENLQAKLAASRGIALHPGAIKEAAAAVVEAEASLDRAESALVELGPRPLPFAADADGATSASGMDHALGDEASRQVTYGGGDPVLRQPVDDFDEVTLERRRALTRGIALFFVLTGLGVVALGLDLPVVITVVLAISGFVLGVAVVVQGRRAAAQLADDKADSAARLANLPDSEGTALGDLLTGRDSGADLGTESGDSTPAAAPAPAPKVHLDVAVGSDAKPDDDPWFEARLALDGARDDAEERVRTARRRWRQLAGADADPYDADAVVRAHDPQLAFDAQVAEVSPTVRTVAAFHRKAQARWRVLWASLGRDEPPLPEQLDAVLEELVGGYRRAQRELAALEQAEAAARAELGVRRPLVLVEPSAWVAPGRLTQLLSSVPPTGQVVVVERDGAGPAS